MEEQRRLGVNVKQMLEDELGWLQNFVPSHNPELAETDNLLIAGHVKLIRTLMTNAGVDKREFGNRLFGYILVLK